MAGISKSEKRKGCGVMGVVLLARCVVDLSVVLVFAVVVVVVVVVVDIVGGNFLRLPKGEAMSFGLFLSEAEKLAFFGGLKKRWK